MRVMFRLLDCMLAGMLHNTLLKRPLPMLLRFESSHDPTHAAMVYSQFYNLLDPSYIVGAGPTKCVKRSSL